jgi:hypothetical protein
MKYIEWLLTILLKVKIVSDILDHPVQGAITCTAQGKYTVWNKKGNKWN